MKFMFLEFQSLKFYPDIATLVGLSRFSVAALEFK